MSLSKQTTWALVAGVGALALGMTLYAYYESGKQEEISEELSKVIQEIKLLGEPKREPHGILAFSYYKDVFSIIIKHTKANLA
jgi:hypothetical protein